MQHPTFSALLAISTVCAVGALAQSRDLRYERDKLQVTQQTGSGKLWALVVGVSEYKNVPPRAQLKFAHRDAEEFARFLRTDAGGAIPGTQMQLLTNSRATLAAIRAALETWLPRVVGPKDVVYIFFAGHGVVAEQNQAYFVAHDSDPQNLHATGLPFAEVNEILTTKLKAGTIVLLADSCHAGTIGWSMDSAIRGDAQASFDSLGGRDQSLLKLLASRPSEQSFEDERWDGGHGVFTYALLNGLRGGAERDRDGTIRVSQLISYVSKIVPQQTGNRQNPRVAGNFEPRLVLAHVMGSRPEFSASLSPVEISGPAGASIYLDRAYRGSIRATGDLRVEAVAPGSHRLEVELPGGDSFEHTVTVATGQTRLNLNSLPEIPIMALQSRIRQGNIVQSGGAWEYYSSQKFPSETKMIADSLMAAALEETGQACVNDYVQSNAPGVKGKMLADAAEAYRHLRELRPGDLRIDAKLTFCDGRAQIAAGQFREAVQSLRATLEIDSSFACAYNALGVALARLKRTDEARAAFERAAQLTPEWFLPLMQMAQQYIESGNPASAVPLLEKAVKLSPRVPLAQWTLVRALRLTKNDPEFARRANELMGNFPNYAPAYLEVAAFQEAHGNFARAVQAYNAYLALAPNFEDSTAVRTRAEQARSKMAQTPPEQAAPVARKPPTLGPPAGKRK